ncbi:MAG: M67 family metallopeptidase [Deltaproteobacteria bacterium]|nr:M67 family metallopeptidase [Deltaproteobacteria bacterium]
MARLIITAAQLRVVDYEATHAWPAECCGLLFGAETDAGDRVVTHVLPSPNLFAGDKRQGYTLDPRALLVAERFASRGLATLGLYHSHPQPPASPSETDRAAGTFGWSYLIVALADGRVVETKSFRLADDGSHFEAEVITKQDDEPDAGTA